MNENIRKHVSDRTDISHIILHNEKKIKLLLGFKKNHTNEKRYLYNLAVTIENEFILSDFADFCLFKEELGLFDKGDTQNKFFTITSRKWKNEQVISLEIETRNNTKVYISKSEAKAMYSILYTALASNSYSQIFDYENDQTVENWARALYEYDYSNMMSQYAHNHQSFKIYESNSTVDRSYQEIHGKIKNLFISSKKHSYKSPIDIMHFIENDSTYIRNGIEKDYRIYITRTHKQAICYKVHKLKELIFQTVLLVEEYLLNALNFNFETETILLATLLFKAHENEFFQRQYISHSKPNYSEVIIDKYLADYDHSDDVLATILAINANDIKYDFIHKAFEDSKKYSQEFICIETPSE